MDTVISLRRPLNYCITDGRISRCTSPRREASRRRSAPFEAKLSQTDRDKLNWTVQELKTQSRNNSRNSLEKD